MTTTPEGDPIMTLEPAYTDGPVTIYLADCIQAMRQLPDASVDSVVTDPPYGLEFMGREWDGADGFRRSLNAADVGRENTFGRMSAKAPEYRAGKVFQDWCEAWATECLRVLKPGGHLLAFGGTRTFHRLTAGIEDAGFEIRDSIAWIHAQGFPKTTAVLKPSFEPVTVARKPLAGTVAANVEQYGTGALNIEDSRLAHDEKSAAWVEKWAGTTGHQGGMFGSIGTQFGGATAGRWPTNVAFDEHQAAALDQQTGELKSGLMTGKRNVDKFRNVYGAFKGSEREAFTYGDTGGASRFFYTSKATTDERPKVDGVSHPTVKPLDLMRWLVKLATPKGGVVLEPFAGSGTTVEAAILESFTCIAIEREPDYLPLILKRIQKPHAVGFDFGDWDGAA